MLKGIPHVAEVNPRIDPKILKSKYIRADEGIGSYGETDFFTASILGIDQVTWVYERRGR